MCQCLNCSNLDKSNKEISNNCFRYGCKELGYICFWINNEYSKNQISTALDNGGCSDFKKKVKEQLSLF